MKLSIKNMLTLCMLSIVLLGSAIFPAVQGYAAGAELQRFKMLLDYARISEASYQGEAQFNKVLAGMRYQLVTHGQLPGYGVSYYLASDDNARQQLLVVRGTSNVENVMVDVAFKLVPNRPTGIKLHQGFAQSADFIFDRVKPYLNKDSTLHTSGHSLGGAVAVILAMYADVAGYKVGPVITYGQPKVTNVSGSRQYSHLDITRVVMPRDMVPLVPPFDPMDIMKLDLYWHLGTEIVLHEANTYSELKGMESMLRATDFLNESISENNLKHHMMSQYIEALLTKQQDPRSVPYENDFSLTDLLGGVSAGSDKQPR